MQNCSSNRDFAKVVLKHSRKFCTRERTIIAKGADIIWSNQSLMLDNSMC